MSNLIVKVIVFGKTAESVASFIEMNFKKNHADTFHFIAVIDEGEPVQCEPFEVQTAMNPEPRHPITFFMGFLKVMENCNLEANYLTSFSTKMIFNPGAIDRIIEQLQSHSGDPTVFFMEGALSRAKDTYYWFNTVPYHWPLVPIELWSELGSFCFYYDTSVAQAIFLHRHLGYIIPTRSLGEDLLAPYPFSANDNESPKNRYCDLHYQTNGEGLLTFHNFYHLLAVQKYLIQIKDSVGLPLERAEFQSEDGRFICKTPKGIVDLSGIPDREDFRLYWKGIRRNMPMARKAKKRLWDMALEQYNTLRQEPVTDVSYTKWGPFFFLWSMTTLDSILNDLISVGGISLEHADKVRRYVSRN